MRKSFYNEHFEDSDNFHCDQIPDSHCDQIPDGLKNHNGKFKKRKLKNLIAKIF